MEPLVERIRKVMGEKGLSPSHFADAIGIQRPAVSHILSGRNRPSLDVVYKILERFKEIDPAWLLTGKGSMKAAKEEKKPEAAPVRPASEEAVKAEKSAGADLFKSVLEDVKGKKGQIHLAPPVQEKIKAKEAAGKAIEQIVIFYSDGSCHVYFPG